MSFLDHLSPDGITRSFNDAASGYARSEAIVVLYLQRARNAKRIYVEIKGTRAIMVSSYDRNSVLHATCEFQMEVMKLTLEDRRISGKDVSFVEADKMGIKETDAEEVKAIDKVYN
ncbi:fatty acid synthase-like [Belonocnema kinseyi]|uniref:fatty acid synthase-like n=1 Tax=Belonocnema kinseyi TaxID=2817044 RepID=UPI00143DB04B|nr:fatty acid synthase-like [Belonocnema kinseyi]